MVFGRLLGVSTASAAPGRAIGRRGVVGRIGPVSMATSGPGDQLVADSDGRAARVALGDRLEEQDRARHRGVQRADRPAHRDADQEVAAPPDDRTEALAFAADDDRQRTAQVGLREP